MADVVIQGRAERFDTIGHLGLIYLATLVFVSGRRVRGRAARCEGSARLGDARRVGVRGPHVPRDAPAHERCRRRAKCRLRSESWYPRPRARAPLPLSAKGRRALGGASLGERSLGAGGATVSRPELGVPPISARRVGRSRPQHVPVAQLVLHHRAKLARMIQPVGHAHGRSRHVPGHEPRHGSGVSRQRNRVVSSSL